MKNIRLKFATSTLAALLAITLFTTPLASAKGNNKTKAVAGSNWSSVSTFKVNGLVTKVDSINRILEVEDLMTKKLHRMSVPKNTRVQLSHALNYVGRASMLRLEEVLVGMRVNLAVKAKNLEAEVSLASNE